MYFLCDNIICLTRTSQEFCPERICDAILKNEVWEVPVVDEDKTWRASCCSGVIGVCRKKEDGIIYVFKGV